MEMVVKDCCYEKVHVMEVEWRCRPGLVVVKLHWGIVVELPLQIAD